MTVATSTGTLTSLTIAGKHWQRKYCIYGLVEGRWSYLARRPWCRRYGKNGFHLNFSDSSTNEALGFDSAPTTPDPDPKKGMDVITYSGNVERKMLGVCFSSLGWYGLSQGHQQTGRNQHLYDTCTRQANKYLSSHLIVNCSRQVNKRGYVTSFNPDGFNLGSLLVLTVRNNKLCSLDTGELAGLLLLTLLERSLHKSPQILIMASVSQTYSTTGSAGTFWARFNKSNP